jgi:hypothetical protein
MRPRIGTSSLETSYTTFCSVDFLGHTDDTKLGILYREVVPLRLSSQAGSSDREPGSNQVEWIRGS